MLFTRTTLFTTLFIIIILVCSLKSIGIPSFVLVFVSYKQISFPIITYGLRLFLFYKQINMLILLGLQISIIPQSFVS